MTPSCLSSPSPSRSVRKKSGVGSSRRNSCFRSSPVTRMARTSSRKKRARRKSRNWAAMISCIASSSKLTIWQNWPMQVPGNAMATPFPRTLKTAYALSCTS